MISHILDTSLFIRYMIYKFFFVSLICLSFLGKTVLRTIQLLNFDGIQLFSLLLLVPLVAYLEIIA